jgi:hypothetical protein
LENYPLPKVIFIHQFAVLFAPSYRGATSNLSHGELLRWRAILLRFLDQQNAAQKHTFAMLEPVVLAVVGRKFATNLIMFALSMSASCFVWHKFAGLMKVRMKPEENPVAQHNRSISPRSVASEHCELVQEICS